MLSPGLLCLSRGKCSQRHANAQGFVERIREMEYTVAVRVKVLEEEIRLPAMCCVFESGKLRERR